jgi:UrcA family protein
MRNRSPSSSSRALRKGLCAALACGTMSVLSAGAFADAAYPASVTITAPREKTVGREYATHAPIVQLTARARVPYVPVTLTTHSGVALLKDRVFTAARDLCTRLDPLGGRDWSCIRDAVDQAQPQIDAAIERAEQSEARG